MMRHTSTLAAPLLDDDMIQLNKIKSANTLQKSFE